MRIDCTSYRSTLIKYLLLLTLFIAFPSVAIAEPGHNEMGVYYVPVPYDHPVKPKPPELPYSIRSNCYAYVEYRLGDLPSMADVQATAHPQHGNVAVFNYHGIPHVAVVEEFDATTFSVTESNFKGDFVSHRVVTYTDASLKGFVNI